jgi:16S rRNA C967 or C1407 C5-methylase (RsmB/RsmF family)/NOL1/NOP2/fmu family ribosome biogenesis protein
LSLTTIPQQLLHSLEGVKGFNKEAFEQVHASGEQITSIRLNPDKRSVAIDNRPATANWQPSLIPWCPNGRYLRERPFFTFDPVFHAGAYYVQEASSMFLWDVLKQTIGTSSHHKVLDLCAAPGGKTTLLDSFFTDGLVVANEVIKSRAAILTENVIKWGSDHVIVTNNDPKDFQRLENYFDVIVIDAPCSGSGLFRKDPNAIDEWSEDNVTLCSLRQQRIINDVLPALKENGLLIYSTCSYSSQEDEAILDWMVSEYEVSSVAVTLNEDWGIVGVQSPLHQAFGYRFFPYNIKGEGFFLAVLKKTGGGEDSRLKELALTLPSRLELMQIQAFLPLPLSYSFFKQNDSFRAIPDHWLKELKLLARQLYIKKAGVELGSIKGKDFIPSHEVAVSLLDRKNFAFVKLDEQQALQYLRKKELVINTPKGWCLVTHCGLPLGWIKVLPNRINNYYPGEWRILKD